MASIKELLKSRERLDGVEAARKAAYARSLGPYGIWSWMYDRLNELPRRSLSRSAHERLWNGGLRYELLPAKPNGVGDFSTRLLAAAFEVRKNVCILLPPGKDVEPHILSSLVVAWCLEDKALKGNNRVLCISGRSGVQRYLRKATVGQLKLADVLTLEADGRSKQSVLGSADAELPYVVCACRPAEPATLLANVKPDLVLLDLCGDDPGPWIGILLKAARARKCAVCIWTNNPITFSCADLSSGFLRFRWAAVPSCDAAQDGLTLRGLVVDDRDIELEAVHVPCTEGSAAQVLARANLELVKAKPFVKSTIAASAYRLVTRYVRAMTRLPVPLSVYEAKCRDQWGMRSIASLKQSVEQFFTHWHDAPESLLASVHWATEAESRLATSVPPLGQFAIESYVDRRWAGVLFPTKSLTDAFKEFASNEYYVDFEASGLPWLGCPGRGQGMPSEVLHVGLPSTHSIAHDCELLKATKISVAHYPFERPLLHHLFSELNRIWPVDTRELTECVASLTGKEQPPTPEIAYPRITLLDGIVDAELSTFDEERFNLDEVIPKEAWACLLDGGDNDLETEQGSSETGVVWVDRVAQVNFVDGRCIRLSQDEQVQSVRDGKFQEIAADELETCDEMLVVDGARRQDLYSLILDRLHSGTTVATFVDIVERWRSELATQYRGVWRANGGTYRSLLTAIRGKGSKITTEQTVRAWVLGWHLPQDRTDIRRVANCLSMPFAMNQYWAIASAATQLANVHRAISRQINTWLELRISSPSRAIAAMNAEVDSVLGVSLRDFYDAVVVLEVESVQIIDGGMPSSALGHLVSRDE